MFRFIQYVERQIVLFDAIEDAAFNVVNNMEGRGSLRNMKEKAEQRFKKEELIAFLNDFKVEENKKYALIFGHEVNGVQQEIISMCDMVIEVPQQGSKHSLNISVCVGVVSWEFVR